MKDEADGGLLQGIRVIEVATMVFAPSTCVVMADFGADVIKVEPPGAGDLNRHYHKLPGMPVSDLSYTFQADNRNKRSIALDLKSPAGHAALLRLVETADVFVTNYRPAALDRLKLDYGSLRTLNPRLVYAAGTGWGDDGPERDKPGYDNVSYWSRSAIEPQVFPFEGWLNAFPYGAGDRPTGMSLFGAVMLGLYQREKTGTGCRVATSLLASGAWANATMLQAQLCNAKFQPRRPRANAYNFTSLHYRSRDGRLLKLGMVNMDKDWVPFCRALGVPELAQDPRFHTAQARASHMAELIAVIDGIFAGQDMEHWHRAFETSDVPHAVLPTYEEAANDPQKAANRIVVPLEHGEAGSIRTVSSPLEVSGYPKRDPTAAPGLGEHTREVLAEAGYSAAEIDRMLQNGAAAEQA